ncbi:MAG: Xylose isomerase domain protein barrel [Verrucomicrobiales bacterium]|jgi:sugar phosphate isomerase/epimerase|nr:Xylose isomerase domain protein barrel [Verrucomicrobiales bacterium]MDB6128974.1 Xylose isomerase domain protein barrel [Verrucomicrobiales bacterium]
MLQEIASLGFEYAELSHGIRISLLPGIFQAVDEGVIKISTLHNFCPLPMGVSHAAPNIYLFSSPNQRERENAYRHSIKTLETAERLNAKLVVLHMGMVEMKEYTDKLVEMIGEGKRDTSKYHKLCLELQEKREEKKEKYYLLSYDMLSRILEKAEAVGLLLGIENREALEEIPFDHDFDLFFKEFTSPNIRYWHDTGHAQIKENLGFINHVVQLENYSSRLAGFHIHDVEFPGKDHRSPGSGMIDFASIKPFVKPEHLKVFEFSPSLTMEQAVAGIRHIKNLWGTD